VDYEALYRFRFIDVDPVSKRAVWRVIAADLARRAGNPRRVLDPACGSGEFILGVPAAERWAADVVPPPIDDAEVRVMVGRYQDLDLPRGHFDAILFSNVLEHLADPDEVQQFLQRAKDQLAPGGRVIIMGPNFKYCAKEYFDCADHTLVLTDVSVVEHLVAAGYRVDTVVPRYIPYSFRSRLPADPRLTAAYLRMPFVWRFLGKQFLVIATPSR
jgi:SAM-dependent methyltransferase